MTLKLDQINRHRERARCDRADLDAVLDAGHHVGTLSTVVDGRAVGRADAVRPRRRPDPAARLGRARAPCGVAAGAPAALCVTHIDGWVYAHTLFDSSANYRSAVVHGALIPLSGDDAVAALTAISECLTPGRSAEVPPHTHKQLAATTALAMDITDGQWTVKVRDAGPGDPEDGRADPGLWTGSCRSSTAYRPPQPAARVAPGTPVSPSSRGSSRRRAAAVS